jgi:hypothetical protein
VDCGFQDPQSVLQSGMPPTRDSLPDDVATLKAMVIAAQAARLEAEAKARNAEAEVRALRPIVGT